ncbi:MAG: putative sulfate exporter family transporter [Chloroflexota bacterium]
MKTNNTLSTQALPLPPAWFVVGFGLALGLGLAAYWVSTLHDSLEALAVALLLGVAVRSLLGDQPRLRLGVKRAVQIFVPLGIILYGVRLDIPRLGSLAVPVILRTLLNMALFYLVVFGLAHWWKVRHATRTLLASGSAVCGASAIVVLAPAVEAESEDTSVSLIIVTAIGLLGAMLYPVLRVWLGWSDSFYAVLAGSTLHQTATVKLAVAGLSKDVVSYALTVKMVRVVMLIPIALLMAWFNRRRSGSWRKALGQIWFVFVFAVVGLLVSFTPLRGYQSVLQPWSTLALTLAMASIGLTVNLEAVINAGLRPLFIGLIAWLVVVALFVISIQVFPLG